MAALTDCPGIEHPLHPITGFQQLTIIGDVVGLTVPQDAVMALVNVQGADVYWRDDGTDPNHDTGMLAKQDTTFAVCGGAMGTIKFIWDDITAAINVSYYGNPK